MQKTVTNLPEHYFIPLYCVFISLLLFVARDLDAAQSSPITLSNIHRVICIPLSIAYTSLYFLTYKRMRKMNLVLILFFSYICVGILSTYLFSEWFYYSIWKLLEMLAVLLTSLYCWTLELYHPGATLLFYKKTIGFLKIILLSVVASLVMMPSTSIELASSISDAYLPYRITGQLVKVNAISIASISSLILYILIVKYSYKKKYIKNIDYFWFVLSVLLLFFAQSRTAIAGLICALTLLLFLTKKTSLLKKLTIIISSGFIIYFFSSAILEYLQRGQSAQSIYSLTGRFTWWEFAYNKIKYADLLNQIFGYGYGYGNRIVAKLSSNNLMQTLDSSYLSSLIDTGFLGVSILLTLVVYTNVKLYSKAQHNILYLELAGVNMILTVKSITTSTIEIFTYYTLLFMLIALTTDKRLPSPTNRQNTSENKGKGC